MSDRSGVESFQAASGRRERIFPAGLRPDAESADEGSETSTVLGYGLFLMVTGVMLVRPTDLHPALYALPLYEAVIIPCILVSLLGLVEELSPGRLAATPTSVCILGLWVSMVVSSVGNGMVDLAVNFSLLDYGKVVLLYLLLLSQVTTPGRLRMLMIAILVYTTVASAIAVLHYHGYITIQSLQVMELEDESSVDRERGTFTIVRRLCGTGVFNDPNDLCQNVAVAVALGIGQLTDRRQGVKRFLWLLPLCLLAYTMKLTQSRGGLLAGVVGLAALIQFRLRSRKALIISGMLALVLLGVMKGRQGSISFQEGTGKSRLELWAESLPLLRNSPLFGVGPNQFSNYAGHVAHNSFVEAYVDMGVVGGAFHFGAYYYVLGTLWRLGSRANRPPDFERQHLLTYAFAALTTYTVGELSLTHPFSVTTALYLGMATATLRICQPVPPPPGSRFSPKLLMQFLVLGLLFYLGLMLFAKTNAQWG